MNPRPPVYVVFVVSADGKLAYDEHDRAYLWAYTAANRQAAQAAAHLIPGAAVRIDRPVGIVL